MAIAVLIGVAVLAVGLGVALGRYVWPAPRNTDSTALAVARAEITRLEQEHSVLRARAEQLELQQKTASDEAKKAGEEIARLTERVEGFAKQRGEQTKSARVLQLQRDGAISEATAAAAEIARLKEREICLTQRIDSQDTQRKQL